MNDAARDELVRLIETLQGQVLGLQAAQDVIASALAALHPTLRETLVEMLTAQALHNDRTDRQHQAKLARLHHLRGLLEKQGGA